MRIDFNKEEYCDYLEGLIISNTPIPFYNYNIYQISVAEAFKIGEGNLNDLILPFAITKDVIEGFSDLDLGILDLLALVNDDKYIKNIINMLSIVLRVDVCNIKAWNYIDESKMPRLEIIVEDNLWIDNFKFEEIKKIILKTTNSKEIDKKSLKSKSIDFEKQVDKNRFAKLFKGRERECKKKNKSLKLYNIYNSVVHNQPIIDYEKVLQMTIYQLYNSFTSLNIKENHNYTMRLASSGMVDIKGLEIKPFSEKITK